MFTIEKRYYFTLIAMVLKSGIAFLTTIFIAKELGIKNYGDYTYLISTFMAIRQLSDLGASSAFYTYISRSSNSGKLIKLYISWVIFQFIFIALILCVLPNQWLFKLWMHDDKYILLAAYMATFMQGSLWLMATQIAEAKRMTILSQSINITAVTVNMLIIFLLWYFNKLGIYSLIIVAILEWFLASIVLIFFSTRSVKFSEGSNFDYVDFLKYIKPLILYTVFGCIAEFSDRWMLQNWFGGIQQGGLAIALQISTVILILTTSSIQIFWKEISDYHKNFKYKEIEDLYSKTSKTLFLIGAIISGVVIVWSKEILIVFLGLGYEEQSLTLTLIIIYTLLLALYQISGVVLYAIGKTAAHVSIGIFFRATGILLSFIILSPANIIEIGFSGSEKLAIKMLIVQLFMTIIEGLAIKYYLKINTNYSYFIKVFIALLTFGIFIKLILIYITDDILVSMAIASIVYFISLFSMYKNTKFRFYYNALL